MSLLIPEVGLLFWMTLSFGIVFFILAKFAFPTISKGLEKRNRFIHDSLDAARQAETRLANLNQEAEVLMEKAREERKVLLEEAIETKKRIEMEARDAAQAEVGVLKNKAIAEIEESKRRALAEIRDQIVDLSVKIAGKVVSEELAVNQKQKELIDRLLNEEVIYKS